MILEILGDRNLDFCKSVSVAIFGLITLKVYCIDHIMMARCKVDKISTYWLVGILHFESHQTEETNSFLAYVETEFIHPIMLF